MKNSFVVKIKLYLFILVGIIVGILGIYLYSSYEILNQEIKKSATNFLNIYTRDLQADLTALDKKLTNVASTTDLQQLQNKDENKRVLGTISLQSFLRDIVYDSKFSESLCIFDSEYDIFLTGTKNNTTLEYLNFLKATLNETLEQEDYNNFQWFFVEYNNETYIYKYLKHNKIITGIFVNTNSLLQQFSDENFENKMILMVNNKGEIGEVWGDVDGELKESKTFDEIENNKYYVESNFMYSENLEIICLTDKSSVISQIYLSMIVLFVVVVMAILFLIYILYFVKKQIIKPMECIIEDLYIIKDGDFENRIDVDFESKEFQILKDTSNEMVDKIVGLKMQSYIRKIELQDMELKSIQLKLKPHFFLNALTTISNLSSLGENEKIINYVDTLSRNTRYMFKSGISLVSIKEEIEQIENFIFMQELKYPQSVFSCIDLPEELETWEIPHMLIHTFVENIYNHTISVNTVTTILIKVTLYIKEDKDYLLIEIEDDGIGYTKDIIEKVNNNIYDEYNNGSHIGLISLKKLLQLLYKEEDLMVIGNGKIKGCLNKIYIPKATLQN